MEDLLRALDGKEREIAEFLKANSEERDHLVNRLNDLDAQRQRAEEDQGKVRRALDALQQPSEDSALAEMRAKIPTQKPSSGMRAMSSYSPEGRG